MSPNPNQIIEENEIATAALTLASTHQGENALQNLQRWMHEEALTLDGRGQYAAMLLLTAAWTAKPDAVRRHIAAALASTRFIV